MSDFWKAVFRKLGAEFPTSSAYHPQTDGQVERTNETVEIALRFWLTNTPDADGVEYLLRLRSVPSILFDSHTILSANETIHGCPGRDTPSSLAAGDLEENPLVKSKVAGILQEKHTLSVREHADILQAQASFQLDESDGHRDDPKRNGFVLVRVIRRNDPVPYQETPNYGSTPMIINCLFYRRNLMFPKSISV